MRNFLKIAAVIALLGTALSPPFILPPKHFMDGLEFSIAAGTTTAMCTSFKSELMQALHKFTAAAGNSFKVALIKVTPTGTYGAASTNYSNITGNSDEVSGTGYTAGGAALTNIDPTTSGTTAFADFADVSWTTASFSTTAMMIYNTSSTNRSVSTHDFGGTQTVTAGTFTIVFPVADATNAILRIA